ncbi:DUF4082 domain-containing protein [Kribbella sandramycini]|uniref:DUF4082 domain-containing protein n=1 Tax=Kribbella sandramycini TaxID=60450 RepID=A0A7Y4L1D9_9ACTN|nr:DUF4082 domain-containing protein [Kribbella sandramycini]MBB6564857.1 hexosaminidase [Kribbella sandramycini]NOL42555.1 DUF4082 domain-containing protein [Kribbella sandramycini]
MTSRRNFLALTGGVALATGVTAGSSTAQAGVRQVLDVPKQTIPALQEWTARTGPAYELPAPGQPIRIIVRSADAAQLIRPKVVLQEDLGTLLKRTVQVETQETPAPAAGDLVLSLGAPPNQNLEGYEIEVGAALRLRGTPAGVMHGVQTILQWLRQAATVPAGLVRDWPKYPERGFLVANSARHYTMQWWQGQINELAYLKLNMLWVYVGYESTTSLAQLKEIAAYARKYNIALVPQVNMPGHMERLLTPGMGLPGRGDLDLSKDEAYPFARGLFEKYLDEFDTPYWHLGADEYLTRLDGDPNFTVEYARYPQLGQSAKQRYGADANPVDIFTGFLNQMNETVRAHGKQLRVWSDGLLTSIKRAPLNQNIILEHWVTWPGRKTPAELLDAGYLLHNSNGDFLYYDPPNPPNLPNGRFPDPEAIYNRFHPGAFPGQEVDKNHRGLRGAKLHLWTLPATEAEEIQSNNLRQPFRSLAQILWGSPFPFPRYADGFPTLINQVGRPPQYPVGRRRVSPVHGATTVWPQRKPQVVFYDDVDPASVSLREGGIEAGTPGQTTFDPATRTATFTPAAPWRYGQSCGMSFQARDTDGKWITGEWRFTVAQRPSLAYPRSLWNEEDGPAVEYYSDARETELGVRFRVDRPGLVLGAKFYKAPGDNVPHTGSLWSPSGDKLATASFGNESAAGWQEARFAEPVRIDAGGNYTISYHSPNGTFGYNHHYFDGRTQDNGVLHTPTGAGFFAYGPTSYPNQIHLNTNYWADVIFQPETYTVFNVGEAPVFGATEATSLEMGLKFSSSKDGAVQGVRFFKGTHNTGTHTGTLWSASGQKLATATFVGESGSGWQEVRFGQAVSITAGTSYVVSYSSGGGYSATENGLAAARENGALITSGPGLYALRAGDFPTLSYQNRNYFADVVFAEA